MSRAEPEKRRLILATAARLFASRRFHEVKLDDIAAESRLGKGTIYLYFKSKEDLYAALILDGLETLAREEEDAATAGPDPWSELEGIIDALLAFARGNPHLYALMRAGGGIEDARLHKLRARIAAACEGAIRGGVRAGDMADTHPALTAQYLLSFVRVALLYAPRGLKESMLRDHILGVLRSGIGAGGAAPGARKRKAGGTRRRVKPIVDQE